MATVHKTKQGATLGEDGVLSFSQEPQRPAAVAAVAFSPAPHPFHPHIRKPDRQGISKTLKKKKNCNKTSEEKSTE